MVCWEVFRNCYEKGDRDSVGRANRPYGSTGGHGTVEIIDHYPGGHSSIDVMSGDTLYKHLSLDDVLVLEHK